MTQILIHGQRVKMMESPNSSPRPEGVTPRMIVLHSTGGRFESALNWLRDPQSHVSAHFLIGRDGATVQLVPLERAAWHAGRSWWGTSVGGSVNAFSIGIELEHVDGKQDWPEAQLQALCALLKALCARYHIAVHDVAGHADVARPIGRKVDPSGFPWGRLRAELHPGPVVVMDGERIPARILGDTLYAPARRLLEKCGRQGRWDPTALELLVTE